MKVKLRYVCFLMWIICAFGIIHIHYIQKQELSKNKNIEDIETKIKSDFKRANFSKKNIINILIIIINKTCNNYEKSERITKHPAQF